MHTSAEWEQQVGGTLRRARLDRQWSQQRLASKANVGLSSVRSLENARGSTLLTFIAVVRALDLEPWLASLYPEPEVSPMQLLTAARSAPARQRAPKRST